jgi:arylsulfatase
MAEPTPSRSPARAALTRLLTAVSLIVGCGGEPAPPAVLLISIDTLRPDHLGIYGYARDTSPNIDRYFASGAVYERAYATGSRTPPSVASMLTGRYPAGHRVRLFYQKLPRRIASIPDLLPAGFQTAGLVGNAVVADDAMGLASRFDHFEDEVDRPALYTNNVERSAEALTDAALRWLGEVRDPERPFFLWVHYMDPHSPYLPPESWQRRGYDHDEPQLVDPARLAQNNIQREEAEEGQLVDALISLDAYDEEIAYTDHHIGRLLDAFDAASSPETAMVLLTADHGESMLEHTIYFVHGYQVYDEMVRIPLLLRAPGVEAGPRDRLVSLVDVLPTVLGHALVAAPRELPGRDLRPRSGPPERRVFAETIYLDNQWRAAWQGRDKWVLEVAISDGRPERGYHYDLARDPGELSPSQWSPAAPPAPAAAELRERAERDPDPAGLPNSKRANADFSAPNAAGDIAREQLEKLRALGYVE